MRRIVPDTQAALLGITNSKPSFDARVTYSGGEVVLRGIFICGFGRMYSQWSFVNYAAEGHSVGSRVDAKEMRSTG